MHKFLMAQPVGVIQLGLYDEGDAKFVTIQMQHETDPEACTLDEAIELGDALEEIVSGRKPGTGVMFGDRRMVVVSDDQPQAIAIGISQCKHLIAALRETVDCAVKMHPVVDISCPST
ncbi:hypothetical protein [Aestuariivirga litoralis]|uniref:hypothetical protein n=1 Tax=Aestuariivirga litoralis TaxID=2650924 RepID=UPI0018C617E3|nr:hypothetical protein [Aestuariivirga litoralis]MBG1231079.1 hypothetical protein [Aestuariivirga litoralis]